MTEGSNGYNSPLFADFLGFRKLERTMSTTRFRSITKLDLNPQLSILV